MWWCDSQIDTRLENYIICKKTLGRVKKQRWIVGSGIGHKNGIPLGIIKVSEIIHCNILICICDIYACKI